MGLLNIHDVAFAHNVPAYTATRKWRVLKVTPQVAAPGAESAVCDWLVAVAATLVFVWVCCYRWKRPARYCGNGR